MKLYHIGSEIIKEPDFGSFLRNADFGKGFYLSNDRDFVLRLAKMFKDSAVYINVYELDTVDLKIKKLRKDKKWFTHIYRNRRNSKDTYEDYDVVIGPIANDAIFDTLGMTTSGIFSDHESMAMMKLGNRYTQVVIKTEKALNSLKWEEAEELKEEDIDNYRQLADREEKKYRKKLADLIARF